MPRPGAHRTRRRPPARSPSRPPRPHPAARPALTPGAGHGSPGSARIATAARRSSGSGLPPGHNADSQTRTSSARRTTGNPGAGTLRHGGRGVGIDRKRARPYHGHGRHRLGSLLATVAKRRRGGISHVQRGRHDPGPPTAARQATSPKSTAGHPAGTLRKSSRQQVAGLGTTAAGSRPGRATGHRLPVPVRPSGPGSCMTRYRVPGIGAVRARPSGWAGAGTGTAGAAGALMGVNAVGVARAGRQRLLPPAGRSGAALADTDLPHLWSPFPFGVVQVGADICAGSPLMARASPRHRLGSADGPRSGTARGRGP